MPSTVVIQIIGLVLLSYQIESGHLLAVAPRIPCPPSPDTRWKAGSAEQAMLEAGVEEHATTLEFAASDFVSVSGWTTEYVDPPSNTTMRIRLDGDHLRFVPSPFRREQTAKIQATQSDPNDLGL